MSYNLEELKKMVDELTENEINMLMALKKDREIRSIWNEPEIGEEISLLTTSGRIFKIHYQRDHYYQWQQGNICKDARVLADEEQTRRLRAYVKRFMLTHNSFEPDIIIYYDVTLKKLVIEQDEDITSEFRFSTPELAEKCLAEIGDQLWIEHILGYEV